MESDCPLLAGSRHWLAVNGKHKNVAKLLLSAGADINATDSDGKSPLHVAARFGHVEFVQFLIDNGADLEIKNNEGETPLGTAISFGQTEVAELIQRNGSIEREKG